jgi:hypothetical protein
MFQQYVTSRVPAANSTNHDTRSFDLAMLNLGYKISCARSMPHSFIEKRGVRHGVVCAHVMCHALQRLHYLGVSKYGCRESVGSI